MLRKHKVFRILIMLGIVLLVLFLILYLVSFIISKVHCPFKDINIQRSIETKQVIPEKSLIVHAVGDVSVIQMYDIDIFFKYKLAECEPIHTMYIQEDGSTVQDYSTKPCEEDKKIWLLVKKIVDEYEGDVEYESLKLALTNYSFPNENDSRNIISEIYGKISGSLESGNVTIRDRNGNIVNSILYKSEGMANCYDRSGYERYELDDGTVIVEHSFNPLFQGF